MNVHYQTTCQLERVTFHINSDYGQIAKEASGINMDRKHAGERSR